MQRRLEAQTRRALQGLASEPTATEAAHLTPHCKLLTAQQASLLGTLELMTLIGVAVPVAGAVLRRIHHCVVARAKAASASLHGMGPHQQNAHRLQRRPTGSRHRHWVVVLANSRNRCEVSGVQRSHTHLPLHHEARLTDQ